MSITVELPSDIESQVRAIPDLDQRIADFLRNQAAYEQWRAGRYNEKVRRLAEEGMAEGERLKAEGVSREEMFGRLFAVLEKIESRP